MQIFSNQCKIANCNVSSFLFQKVSDTCLTGLLPCMHEQFLILTILDPDITTSMPWPSCGHFTRPVSPRDIKPK